MPAHYPLPPEAARLAMPAHAPALEGIARRYAAMPRTDAEALIDQQVALAVKEWRIADATFWQRVRFRSRMMRTATRSQPAGGEG